MDNVALERNLTSAVGDHGEIVALEKENYFVRVESGRIKAERALGCVVEPMVGDLVAVSCGQNGQAFILSVLKRRTQSRVVLNFPNDVLIRSEAGNVSVSARQDLNMAAGRKTGMVSPTIQATAEQGDFHIQRASFFGKFLLSQIDVVKTIADSMESFCQRLTSLSKHSHRQVEEVDQLRCGRLDYEADSLLHLQGEFARVEAEEDVHIGGERINIG